MVMGWHSASENLFEVYEMVRPADNREMMLRCLETPSTVNEKYLNMLTNLEENLKGKFCPVKDKGKTLTDLRQHSFWCW